MKRSPKKPKVVARPAAICGVCGGALTPIRPAPRWFCPRCGR